MILVGVSMLPTDWIIHGY